MRYGLALAAAIAILPFCGGCAGSGAGLDQNGQPITAGGPPGGPLTAEFDSIQQNVFTPICTICHAGAGAPQGLRLDAANSYSLLVGVPSTEESSVLRVRPGDPGNSYLVQKLEGHAAVGAQMPFGGPPLPAATIAVIRQWISDGAQRPAITSAARDFALATVAPARGDVLAGAPANLVMGFSEELDQTRIDSSSVRLVGEPGAAADAAGPEVAIKLEIAAGNARVLIVTPRVPLPAGHYRLVIGAAPATGLSAISGQRLAATPASASTDVVATEFDVTAAR